MIDLYIVICGFKTINGGGQNHGEVSSSLLRFFMSTGRCKMHTRDMINVALHQDVALKKA